MRHTSLHFQVRQEACKGNTAVRLSWAHTCDKTCSTVRLSRHYLESSRVSREFALSLSSKYYLRRFRSGRQIAVESLRHGSEITNGSFGAKEDFATRRMHPETLSSWCDLQRSSWRARNEGGEAHPTQSHLRGCVQDSRQESLSKRLEKRVGED